MWDKLASDEVVGRAVKALVANGIDTVVCESREAAKAKVLEMIPEGSEVMTMTSMTLEEVGLSEVLNESGKYVSERNKLYSLDREKNGHEMKVIGAVPKWCVGSVHAVTEAGELVIASNTGSQLGAYAYGAERVVWVVGAQKIVKNLDEALKRIYEYTLGLESERARKAYGVAGSNVSKLLVINKEIVPGRVSLVLVREKLGF